MIKENLNAIFKEIENGNDLGEKINLIGASKMNDAETINHSIECGLEIVAENRVQEFLQKVDLVKNARWHFIGHLQTNKVKYLVGKVDLIHSVDSIRLGQEISKECVKKEVYQNVLVEINIGGELSKSGFSLENATEGVKELAKLPNIKVVGLMAIIRTSL